MVVSDSLDKVSNLPFLNENLAHHDFILHSGVASSSGSGVGSTVSSGSSASITSRSIEVVDHLSIELFSSLVLAAGVVATTTSTSTTSTATRSTSSVGGIVGSSGGWLGLGVASSSLVGPVRIVRECT